MDTVLFSLMNTAQTLMVLVGLAKFCKIKFGILNLNFDSPGSVRVRNRNGSQVSVRDLPLNLQLNHPHKTCIP